MRAFWRKIPGIPSLSLLPFVAFGGDVSSSSPFSGVEGALIEEGGQKGVGDSVLLEEGRDERVEKEGEDEESWKVQLSSKVLSVFGNASEGFESEILKLLNRIRERRDRSERVSGKKRKRQRLSRFDRELKKLEWSGAVNGGDGGGGGGFTWSGCINNRLKSRIDRFLVSEDWEAHFQGAIQVVLARPVSDNSPILLDGEG
ncbi:hypothetical protein CK203_060971 [Vitis vinifera]|uniref:Uncharacterized protein n=1 Tax=Vitis vinifera TaxID=29760 RepID=A0A438G9F1_VITVI|nr:hypothetical protein CK203_060971 [Vitis vinifera]